MHLDIKPREPGQKFQEVNVMGTGLEFVAYSKTCPTIHENKAPLKNLLTNFSYLLCEQTATK